MIGGRSSVGSRVKVEFADGTSQEGLVARQTDTDVAIEFAAVSAVKSRAA